MWQTSALDGLRHRPADETMLVHRLGFHDGATDFVMLFMLRRFRHHVHHVVAAILHVRFINRLHHRAMLLALARLHDRLADGVAMLLHVRFVDRVADGDLMRLINRLLLATIDGCLVLVPNRMALDAIGRRATTFRLRGSHRRPDRRHPPDRRQTDREPQHGFHGSSSRQAKPESTHLIQPAKFHKQFVRGGR